MSTAGDLAVTRAGFIGLGDIGAPMAARLAGAVDLMVFDLRPEAMEPLRSCGARVAASLSDVMAFAEVIHVCVVHDHDVVELVGGRHGLLHHGRRGQVLAIHSTVMPATVQRIEQLAAKRGIAVLDAPVSGGGRDAAGTGTLTFMVGADEAVLNRFQPLLRAMGERVVHVGPCGAGQVVKLANNIMSHCNRLAYLEAVAFAASFGIPEPVLNEVVGYSSGRSWVQEHFDLVDIHGTRHTEAGTPEHPYRFAKDLRYAVEAAHGVDVAVPITALAAQLAPSMYRSRWDGVAADEVTDPT